MSVDAIKFVVFEFGRPVGMETTIRKFTPKHIETIKVEEEKNPCGHGLTIHVFNSEQDARVLITKSFPDGYFSTNPITVA